MKKTSVFSLFVVVLVCACSFEAAVPKYVGNAGSPPELLEVRVSSSSEVNFLFSEPVSVVSVTFDPPAGLLDPASGETVSVQLDAPYAVGTKVTADILVRNGEGSTLEAVLTFAAFNDRVPVFRITEMRTEMSKPRVEFIELKMLTAGNLAGVRLFIASNGTGRPVYEFPAVEVSAGEYVVLHPRNPDYINGVDETGDDLARSTADDAKAQADCPQNVRDLWFPDNKEALRKSDAVYFMDQMDAIIDAVVFCDKAKEIEKWSGNPHFINAMEILTATGAWNGGNGGSGIDGVFDSSGTSPTNTICRRENASDTNTATDWYKSGSGKASPGKPNALP
ncbi:MAG: hypothetical protein LBT00_15055 [Spirochaetaceae bacterium]|jgi:hypothetical protein|nr:hypothetical protein [Spirochaetaceae bacterium]